jgi:hypothetical protein
MAHQRQIIRDAVVALLRGRTSAGADVFVEDRPRVRQSKLPAIVVFSGDEDSDHKGSAPRELEREAEIQIEIFAAETPTKRAADARDDLALEVENLMHADPYLGGAAGDSYLSGTTVDVDVGGDKIIGAATLTYAVTYRTLAPAAPSNLDDFEEVDARHRIVGITDGPGGTDPNHLLDGHDTFVVEETP